MTSPAADLFSDGVLLRVSIPGEPVAWARPRMKRVRIGSQEVVRGFEAEKPKNWKAEARHMMELKGVFASGIGRPSLFPRPREEALGLIVNAFFSCRKSDERKTKPTGRKWRTARPDADNIAKIVKDAATGVIWLDDSQVVELVVRKIAARQGEAPRVEITVYRVDEQLLDRIGGEG